MLTEPSQLGLPLLPAIWLPAPSTAVFLSPQCPQAGLSPVFNSIWCVLYTASPVLRAQAGRRPAHRVNAQLRLGRILRHKAPTTPEHGPERGGCSGLLVLDFAPSTSPAELRRGSLSSFSISQEDELAASTPAPLQCSTKLPPAPSQHFPTPSGPNQHLPRRPPRTKWLRTKKRIPAPYPRTALTAK